MMRVRLVQDWKKVVRYAGSFHLATLAMVAGALESVNIGAQLFTANFVFPPILTFGLTFVGCLAGGGSMAMRVISQAAFRPPVADETEHGVG